MAGTFLQAVSALGLRTGAVLRSLFLFPFNTFLKAVDLFPNFTLNFRQTNQATLPSSSSSRSRSSSPSSHPGTATNNNHITSHAGDGGMTAPSSSSSAAQPPQKPKPSISSIVPALPRVPLADKGNRPPSKEPTAPSTAADQLSGNLSRLGLEDDGKASGSPSVSLPDAAADGADNQVDDAGAVTRALSAPLAHPVSQTSNPKETAATTIQLGGETVQILAKVDTPEQAAERAVHSRFMREALDMARLALKTNETPVGCVLVYKGRVIARGMNATNVTRNGTRHAELMAISALLSYASVSDLEPAKGASRMPLGEKTNEAQAQAQAQAQAEETSSWVDVDPKDGHLFPYGQKLHPSPRVDPSVITECTLYVTVEPCVMCASLLRQLRIKKVYFGAVNDKFGGTGGVFRIHKNSPHSMATAPPSPAPHSGAERPILEHRPASASEATAEERVSMVGFNSETNVLVSPIEISCLPGDGGNVERGYEAEGGWGRDEAVTLLRQFYVQENNRAPVPRKKEGRAARLAAIMERDGHAGGPLADSGTGPKSAEDSGTDTPAGQEPAAEDTAVAVEA